MQKPGLKPGKKQKLKLENLWTTAAIGCGFPEYGYQTLQTKDESTLASFLATATTKSALLLDCFFAAETRRLTV